LAITLGLPESRSHSEHSKTWTAHQQCGGALRFSEALLGLLKVRILTLELRAADMFQIVSRAKGLLLK